MASHDDAPLPAVALARRQLRSGLAGFPRFLHLLAPEVSPIGAYLVVRHDFLHVARPRDVSLLIFAVALPVLFDKGGDAARDALTGTTLFSGAGVEVLAVLITLLLVRLLAQLIERGVLLATVPGLARIERGVATALDAMIAAPDEAGRAAAVEDLLDRLGVTRYAWYASTGDGRFALRLSRLDGAPAPMLATSAGLRALLGRLDHFLDFRAVARDWPLFFDQFELYRMALATGTRYVLRCGSARRCGTAPARRGTRRAVHLARCRGPATRRPRRARGHRGYRLSRAASLMRAPHPTRRGAVSGRRRPAGCRRGRRGAAPRRADRRAPPCAGLWPDSARRPPARGTSL